MNKCICVLALILIGCSNDKNSFYSETKYIDFKNVYNIVGEKAEIDIMGIQDINIKDTVMILSSYGKEAIFNFVSLNNNKSLGSYGSKGKSSNEFIHPSSILEFTDGADIIFSIYDFGKMELSKINVSKSIESNKIIFEDERVNFKPISIATSHQIDNENYLISYVNSVDFSLYHAIWNSKSKKNNGDILVLKSDMNIEPFLISSVNCISKDKTKYASAMMFLNHINIFNIKDYSKSLTISTSDEVYTLDEINNIEMPEKMEYYCDIKGTEDYIYALYINENRKAWALNDIHTKLHIVDWQGNPIMCLNLDQKIIAFDIDIKNNIIYGLSANDIIYKYDISHCFSTK